MRAITIPEPGEADALVPADVPTPEPAEGEVLLHVVTAGVNRADVQQRKGFYPPPKGASELPGLEVSGRIAALGPGTEGAGWSVGDEVCALLAGGGYAESVAVPVGQLLPVPSGVPLADAAALPEVACTVWSNLVMQAGLREGETVLLHHVCHCTSVRHSPERNSRATMPTSRRCARTKCPTPPPPPCASRSRMSPPPPPCAASASPSAPARSSASAG